MTAATADFAGRFDIGRTFGTVGRNGGCSGRSPFC